MAEMIAALQTTERGEIVAVLDQLAGAGRSLAEASASQMAEPSSGLRHGTGRPSMLR